MGADCRSRKQIMIASEFDCAVFGSTPLASLLAGLLAARQGQRVVLVGIPFSSHRLPLGVGYLPAPVTRPDAWDLLKSAESEMRAFLSEIGAGGSLTVGSITQAADTAASVAAFEHIRHLALAHDIAMVRERAKSAVPALFRAPGTVLNEATLQPILDTWLQGLGVVRLPFDTRLTIQRSTVTLTADDRQIVAKRAILADDDAILSRLNADERPQLLRIVDVQTTVTAATTPLRALLSDYPDRGVTLAQRETRILARIRGFEDADARLASCLGDRLPLRRVATRRFRALDTTDGAPLIGQLKAPRLFIIAGLGDAAPFFAPALARLVAGTASPDERAYFAARDAVRPDARTGVSDLMPVAFA